MNKNYVITFIWAGCISAILTMLHSWHNVKFEAPTTRKIASFISKDGLEATNLIHFIAQGCSCSHHLADYLGKRKALSHYNEQVVIIGNMKAEEQLLRRAGYQVHIMAIDEARDQRLISAVPLYVVYNQAKEVLYAGGYTSGAITPLSDFHDLRIAKQASEKQPVTALPLKGCAVARKYQKLLDPFGFKYGS